MFEHLPASKGDSILSLILEFKNDPRPNKIDLGIGVYRNDEGQTPIMKAVSAAEQRLLEQETTKAYQGLVGDEAFNSAIQTLLLAGTSAQDRASTIQTPGASGALRVLADLIYSTNPNATVWISNPSYVNHRPIMERAGLTVKEYPYLDIKTKRVDEDAMLEQVAQLGKNDVLLLHGCCHNPSGADISADAWQRIAELTHQRGFLPFVDIAYQGLGDGLEKDAEGFQHLANSVPELLLSVSCSKNFGLYRERTGAAIVVSSSAEQANNVRSKICDQARGSYSMPPAHGAAIVSTVLNDPSLSALWREELDAMTYRINRLRQAVVERFRQVTQSQKYDYFGDHKGMFTLTHFDDSVIDALKKDHGIYIVGGGRINIAGLKFDDIDTVVDAIVKHHG